jgi:AbrB family looped-hinge helix DNA binding protein
MNPIIATAKVMQNFTICVPQPIRENLGVKQGDQVILSIDKSGEVKLMKAITTLDELIGIGEKTFKALGGGEAFIKSERKQWDL